MIKATIIFSDKAINAGIPDCEIDTSIVILPDGTHVEKWMLQAGLVVATYDPTCKP